MPQPDGQGHLSGPVARFRRQELLKFLILALGIWPIVAVGVVGGYGILVWMSQLVGPPDEVLARLAAMPNVEVHAHEADALSSRSRVTARTRSAIG
jgi:nitrate reductase NapE